MTICVYYKDILAADGLATNTHGDIMSTNTRKVGMIYECAATGERSLNKESLKFPKEFAMYAFAGILHETPKFLRWFLETTHPTVDSELCEDFSENLISEESYDNLHILVVFKDHDIIREYFGDYKNHVYIDSTKDNFEAIGSGATSARSIHAYDQNAQALDIITAVIECNTGCGGKLVSLSFSEDAVYSDEELDTYLDTVDVNSYIIIKKTASLWSKIKKVFKK